jgi:hypothetical protein
MDASLKQLIDEFYRDKQAYGELVGSLYPSILYRRMEKQAEEIRARGIEVSMPRPPNALGYTGGY